MGGVWNDSAPSQDVPGVLTLPDLEQKAAVCVHEQPLSAEGEEQVTTPSLFSVILSAHTHTLLGHCSTTDCSLSLAEQILPGSKNCLIWTSATPEVRHCLWRWVKLTSKAAITVHQLTCAIEGTGPIKATKYCCSKGCKSCCNRAWETAIIMQGSRRAEAGQPEDCTRAAISLQQIKFRISN